MIMKNHGKGDFRGGYDSSWDIMPFRSVNALSALARGCTVLLFMAGGTEVES